MGRKIFAEDSFEDYRKLTRRERSLSGMVQDIHSATVAAAKVQINPILPDILISMRPLRGETRPVRGKAMCYVKTCFRPDISFIRRSGAINR